MAKKKICAAIQKAAENGLTFFSVSGKISALIKCFGRRRVERNVYDQSRRKRIYRQRAAPF